MLLLVMYEQQVQGLENVGKYKNRIYCLKQ
jgi:hypothetical protein